MSTALEASEKSKVAGIVRLIGTKLSTFGQQHDLEAMNQLGTDCIVEITDDQVLPIVLTMGSFRITIDRVPIPTIFDELEKR